MTNQHPTPPPDLIEQWMQNHTTKYDLARHAAQWGADQELEACCKIATSDPVCGTAHQRRMLVGNIRAARRPKPPSLKEQALALIDECTDPEGDYLDDNALATIRRALQQLPDHE